jgi:hypothetical protein
VFIQSPQYSILLLFALKSTSSISVTSEDMTDGETLRPHAIEMKEQY